MSPRRWERPAGTRNGRELHTCERSAEPHPRDWCIPVQLGTGIGPTVTRPWHLSTEMTPREVEAELLSLCLANQDDPMIGGAKEVLRRLLPRVVEEHRATTKAESARAGAARQGKAQKRANAVDPKAAEVIRRKRMNPDLTERNLERLCRISRRRVSRILAEAGLKKKVARSK